MDELRQWLLTTSLPLWLAHGIDRGAGAFHEQLAPHSYKCTAGFRRLRVAARQIFVFANAHAAGLSGADDAVAIGIEFLTKCAPRRGGGYAARFDLAGNVGDPTCDLYDQAFVLLAFASAATVVPSAPLRRAALDLMAFLQGAFAHPAGGFVESLPTASPRRQNPHMHLLEASLAAHRAFGDRIFSDTASAIVELLLTRFLDRNATALLEFFTDDWQRLPPPEGVLVEPGHCCEWVWLLHEFMALSGPDPRVQEAAAGLLRFAGRHGTHALTGDLVDEVAADRSFRRETSRLWPQTERLKAEIFRTDGDDAARRHAAAQLTAWLKPDGLWCERRDAAGTEIPGPVPASSLYHLTSAILTRPTR